MSSELECRTAIIVALRCGRAPKEIIDFFKFPKATVYSIAKSFKESEDIEEGFLTPERKTPDRSQVRKRSADFIDRLQTMINDDPSVPMSTLAERLYVHKTTVLHAIHEDLRCNSYVLRVRQMLSDAMKKKRLERCEFWSKEFWPSSSPDLNPCNYYLWGVLERDTNKRAHNTVDSLKAAIIQAVANLSREQVAHAVGRFRHRVEAVIVKGG
ncbi:Uncharacterized protein FKW44_007845, partial [Caligus rogercresseyi]